MVLVGIERCALPEIVLAGGAGAIAQSLWKAKVRPTRQQMLFNAANIVLSVAAAYLLRHALLKELFLPAALALTAAVYFAVNTTLVSGVLALLQGVRLADMCGRWYLWSFPYYLAGAAAVGLVLSGSPAAEAALVLLPILYLLHFFHGLPQGFGQRLTSAADRAPSLPAAAKVYLLCVLVAAVAVAIMAVAAMPDVFDRGRFLGLACAAVLTATWKIRLPRMRGTISGSFMILLLAIAEASLLEAIVLAAIAGLVQVLWSPKSRPTLPQVAFNAAALVISVGAALSAARYAHPGSIAANIVIAGLILYAVDTMIVSTMLCLINHQGLSGVWRSCFFWSFPYYLVGAAAAGLMIATTRAAGWYTAAAVLPVMALVWISYRLQLKRAVDQAA
jgi:hypothetical protein